MYTSLHCPDSLLHRSTLVLWISKTALILKLINVQLEAMGDGNSMDPGLVPWRDSLSYGLSHPYCPLLWTLVDVWLDKDSRTSGASQQHLRKRTSKECGRKDQLMTSKGNLGTREQRARHPGNSRFQVSGHFPFLPLLTMRKKTCSFLLPFLAGLLDYV